MRWARTSSSPPIPPGVYRIPNGGGNAVLFASHPNMGFANGLALFGATLYISDSQGTIYTADAAGADNQTAAVWKSDPALQGEAGGTCQSMLPFRIGVNGLVATATHLFAVNTEKATLLQIAVNPGTGTAGDITTVIQDCANLYGVDGLATAANPNVLIAAINLQNKMVQIDMTGSGTPVVTVIDSGSAYDAPASVAVDTVAVPSVAYITNSAIEGLLGLGTPTAGPGVIKLTLQ